MNCRTKGRYIAIEWEKTEGMCSLFLSSVFSPSLFKTFASSKRFVRSVEFYPSSGSLGFTALSEFRGSRNGLRPGVSLVARIVSLLLGKGLCSLVLLCYIRMTVVLNTKTLKEFGSRSKKKKYKSKFLKWKLFCAR